MLSESWRPGVDVELEGAAAVSGLLADDDCSNSFDKAELAGIRLLVSSDELLSSDDRPPVVAVEPCFDGASGCPCKPSMGPDELEFWMDSKIAAIRDEI